MSSGSVAMRVWQQVFIIVNDAVFSTMRAIGNGAMLAAGYFYNEQVCATMNGAVTVAKRHMHDAAVVAGTFSLYDWVFYIICFHIGICALAGAFGMLKVLNNKLPMLRIIFGSAKKVLNWVSDDMGDFMNNGLYCVYRLPTTLLVLVGNVTFYAALSAMHLVVKCLDNRAMAAEDRGTNAVYDWVSTQTCKLVGVMMSPYVYMYHIWMYALILTQMLVKAAFYTAVAIFEWAGRTIWWCVSVVPIKICQLVMYYPRRLYAALVAMKARAADIVRHSGNDMTIYRDEMYDTFCDWYTDSFVVRVCFHVVHTVFLVSVHALAVYTLKAYWTTAAQVPLPLA